MDLNPPQVNVESGKPMFSKEQGASEGVGGWISNLVKRGKGDESSSIGGSGRYKRLDDEE